MNQTAFATVGLYAALNTFILLWLTAATGRLRRKHRVLIGDGGVAHLIRVMRGHANAVENMPMMMVLLLVAAALGAPVLALHLLGLSFTAGRAIHAWHFIQEDGAPWQRSVGFGVAGLAMVVAALGILAHGLRVML